MFLVFLIVAVIAVVWLLLLLSGWLSLRNSRKFPEKRATRGLVLAVAPVLLGVFLLCSHLRFSMNGAVFNLSWPFVFPIALGFVAVIAWVRALRASRPSA